MAIQGDLKEFSVPELFQFMEQHSKNGCLNIKEDRLGLGVYFQEGHIVGMCPDGHSPVEFWYDILVRAGYLSEDEQKHLKKKKMRDLVSFREILVREGIISDQELNELLQRQGQELLLKLLKLRKGSFFFSAEEKVPIDLRLPEPILVEAFLLDGLRMLDEWPIISKRIGSFQRIPHRQFKEALSNGRKGGKGPIKGFWSRASNVLGVHPGPKEDGTRSSNEGEALSSAEIEVYRQINGKRAIKEIIDESAYGEYYVCKAMLSLFEKGWIEFTSPVRTRRGSLREAGRRRSRLLEGIYLLSIMFCASIFVYNMGQGVWEKEMFWKRFSEGRERLIYRYLNQQRRQVVAHALEVYAQERGAYPATLKELENQGLVDGNGLRLLGQNSYSYSLVGKGGYSLMIVPESESSGIGKEYEKHTARNQL